MTIQLSHGRRTAPHLITLIDQLLNDYTDAQIAEQLNQRGWRTYAGKPFHARRILSLRRDYQLQDYGTRLRQRGLLTADEAAKAYGVRQSILMTGDGQVCFPCIGPTIMGSLSLNHPMNTLLRNILTNIKRHPSRTQGGQYAAKSFVCGRYALQACGANPATSAKSRKRGFQCTTSPASRLSTTLLRLS